MCWHSWETISIQLFGYGVLWHRTSSGCRQKPEGSCPRLLLNSWWVPLSRSDGLTCIHRCVHTPGRLALGYGALWHRNSTRCRPRDLLLMKVKTLWMLTKRLPGLLEGAIYQCTSVLKGMNDTDTRSSHFHPTPKVDALWSISEYHLQDPKLFYF